MKKIFYQSSSVPAMQNVLFSTKEEAVSAPCAEITLVIDTSGLVVNSSFNLDLVKYDEDYQNDQGYSVTFKKHLLHVIQCCRQFCLDSSSLIVDVGCGKGGFVELMRSQGLNAVGYDNTYEGNSSYIRKSFFNSNSHEYGDLLTLRHVLEHVQNPWSFIRELAVANCQRGFLYIEVPDLDWILEKKAYFDLFHEHVNYFRKEDFARCFSTALCTTFSLFDGQYLGVILDLSRVMSCNEIVMVPSSYIESLASSFDFLVDHEMNTYGKLRAYNDLVIWGGSSKGVVFASKAPSNILKKIGYAIDINPVKHDKYMPISGIRIRSAEDGIALLQPDTLVVVMNQNYRDEILALLPADQPYTVLC